MRTGRSLFASLAAHSFTSSVSWNGITPLAASAMMSSSFSSSATPPTSPPSLRGVIFDMDGTLTKPNLDFGEMYRRCGVDPAYDILERVTSMPADEQQRALDIIEEMEEEGRRTLELMPGAQELIHWLTVHNIPMAIVTRNTQKTTDVLTKGMSLFSTSGSQFSTVIARDAGYPPKPDPTAMSAIAKSWDIELPTDSLLMVGDSLANDIAFGKNAGVRTALLDSGRRYQEITAGKVKQEDFDQLSPDFVMETLWGLPRQLWKEYHIDGPLGSSQPSIPKVQAPEPKTPLAIAAAGGDVEALFQRVSSSSDSIHRPDESGNTALIWAVERNQEQAVQILLSHPDIDVDHRGFLGATAVSRAARRGFDAILKLLIEKGANLDIANDKLQYPLHFAAFQKHKSTVEILVEHGANPLVLDRKGRTPAQDTSDEEIRELLLEAESRNTIMS